MSDTTLETFLVSGLLVLIAAIGYLAWSAWRWVDRERDMEKLALSGVSHELRLNLKRMLTELSGLADGSVRSEIDIVPVIHPQLDALLSRPNEADRRGLTIIRGNYNELSAHKQSLRLAISQRGDVDAAAKVSADAVIGAISTLYLWEEQKGRPPEAARSTRSWHVRDWMKQNAFDADLLPGMHLRDQVVARLRADGMTLTPKPLSHTASEFYAMQYDRKADPNAPFWKRRAKPAKETETEAADLSEETSDTPESPPGNAETIEAEEAPAASAEPTRADAISPEPASSEPAPETSDTPKPPTPGIVH